MPEKTPHYSPTSFKDPGGSVHQFDGRMIRYVTDQFAPQAHLALRSPVVEKFIDSGQIVRTQEIGREAAAQIADYPEWTASTGIFLEHEQIPFVSYPYEWSPAMLFEAAKLTLDLVQKLHGCGLGLKDA